MRVGRGFRWTPLHQVTHAVAFFPSDPDHMCVPPCPEFAQDGFELWAHSSTTFTDGSRERWTFVIIRNYTSRQNRGLGISHFQRRLWRIEILNVLRPQAFGGGMTPKTPLMGDIGYEVVSWLPLKDNPRWRSHL
jgi:hypothetical protein